jgi:large subunit ribosomal protein L35
LPKLKVSKSAKKRFKISGSGKLITRHAFGSHLLEKKSQNRKRRLSNQTTVSKSDEKNVKKMLGV